LKNGQTQPFEKIIENTAKNASIALCTQNCTEGLLASLGEVHDFFSETVQLFYTSTNLDSSAASVGLRNG